MSPSTSDRERARYEKWARETPAEGRELIPAATVILLRDQGDELETLMLRRNSKLKFVGGMWVFPGGRLDPGDTDPSDDDPLASYRRAATREAEEEAGLAIGSDALHTFSHWVPPAITPKRFETWFFLARAPEGRVTIDGGEIHDHQWIAPRRAMELRDAGEIELAPPTWVTLDRLARHGRVDQALEAADREETEFFETRISMTDDGPVAMWSGDAGYEAGDPSLPGARHRLAMAKAAWQYERSS